MSQSSPISRWLKVLLRTTLVLGLLAAAGWGGYAIWKQVGPGLFGTQREEVVPTTRVRLANISEEILTVGRLRAVFSTELRSEVNGRIIKILAADSQKVERDQEILRLDQQDLLTQLQEMERSIEASKLRAQRARSDFERLAGLQERAFIAPKEFDDARIALSLAENESAIAEARAANIRDRLTKTIIRAPHDGTLLLRDLTEGQVITSVAAQNGGTLLGEVADLTALMVRTNINEIDVARLHLSQVARVRVDSLRQEIMSGTVRRIASSAFENPGDRTRVFPVDVILESSDPRLRPGMSATVTFTLAQVEDVPAIPLSAVFSSADAVRYVFLRQGAGFAVRPVEIGIADTRRVQVVSGLAPDDELALSRPLTFTGEIPTAESRAPATTPRPRRTGI